MKSNKTGPQIYQIVNDDWVYDTIFLGVPEETYYIPHEKWQKVPKDLRVDIERYSEEAKNKLPRHEFPYEKIMQFKHPKGPNFYLMRNLIDRSDWVFIGENGVTSYNKQNAIIEVFKGWIKI